jgi:geranylgeranyl pyrophosphate synthase
MVLDGVTGTTAADSLYDAMRYSVMNGGKRVRPVLVYAAAESVAPANATCLDLIACAFEFLHCYSLIHDDLPAMDDDDLRRGLPTCHRKFDEATAILAGDALQAEAFRLLCETALPAKIQIQLVRLLAQASGSQGMVAGQAIDLAAVDTTLDVDQLEDMHRLKTGALIRAAVLAGGIAAGATQAQLENLDRYARAVGLAFQVQDDVLDVESDTETLGKQQGADAALNKPTYATLLGLAGARQKSAQLIAEAHAAIAGFGDRAQRLHELADFIITRKK